MFTITHYAKGTIPFFLSGNQLKINDAIHTYDKLWLSLPRQCGLTYYIAYMLCNYRNIPMIVISPNNQMTSQLIGACNDLCQHLTTNINVKGNSRNFYSSRQERIVEIPKKLIPGTIVIIPEYEYVEKLEMFENVIDVIRHRPNIKLVMASQKTKCPYQDMAVVDLTN